MYSNIDMISALCKLMARGAIISMAVVIFILPAFLRLFNRFITATSLSFRNKAAAVGVTEPVNEYTTDTEDRYADDVSDEVSSMVSEFSDRVDNSRTV